MISSPTIKAAYPSARERIILALDVETADQARSIIDELRESVGAFKIGLQLFTAAGPAFVREVVESGARVFLDLKFHDIPNTAAKAGVEAARLGIWMFNVHSMGGGEMMRRVAGEVGEACERENLQKPRVVAVTVLTCTDDDALREMGIKLNTSDLALNFAKFAAQCGLDGVVSSPLDAGRIRAEIEDRRFCIVTPGIRPAFATKDDQKRVMTPADAVANGSDYIVVGRPITGSENRSSAANEILREIETAL